jgi:hypothetical protein
MIVVRRLLKHLFVLMKPPVILSLAVALWLAPGKAPAQPPEASPGLPARFSADWAQDSLACNGYRAAYVPALLAAGILRGQSAAVIGRLLGPPNVEQGQGRAFVVVYSLTCTDLAGIASDSALRKGEGPPTSKVGGREMTRLLILEFKRGKCKKAHALVS